jgi:tetratricopeptide (TPR) repeat protein
LSAKTPACVISVLASWWVAAVAAMAAQEPATEAELSQHLTLVRSQIENGTFDLGRREELVIELGGTLDRAAQRSTTAEVRRRHWSEAIDLIDGFLKVNLAPPRERQLQFQAAVYRWAQGQSWQDSLLLDPTNSKPRAEAAAAFDNAIERLRSVSGDGNSPALAENVTFRLAEALADRAYLEPADSPDRPSREAEALRLLETPPTEPSLAGYWRLLKADLLRRTGKPAEAAKELDAATSSLPPPPEREIAEVRVPLLLGQKEAEAAVKSVESSKLEAPVKGLWMVRIRLAQLAGEPAGPERSAHEIELFRWLKELRAGNAPESRLALLELAKAKVEPDPEQAPEVWVTLAEAHAAAGEPAQAGDLMARAAGRAAAAGQSGTAAEYLLRAGAWLFQAGKFIEAEAILLRAADDPAAGRPVRTKAGMLRALALGRAIALGLPGVTMASYLAALERQVREFATDPSADEARWLLAERAIASSDRGTALSLLSVIAPGSNRWLDSRRTIAELDRDELDRLLYNSDRHQITKEFAQADRSLDDAIRQARSERETVELLLARARLDLTPVAGRPEMARELCDRVRRLPATPAQFYRARLYRMVSSVQIARYVEGEREAQSHSSWRLPAELEPLFDTLRLLDQCALNAETDLRQRRFGLVLKLIAETLIAGGDEMPEDRQFELVMRLTRSMLFIGADRDARRSLAAWKGSPPTHSERLLRDLGDTYRRLELYSRAIDVERLRLKTNPAGSFAWFDARYALALAYFHTGRIKEAAQLIDSTAILHPELGGGGLHDKFIHLRQRLGIKAQ